MHLTDTQLVVLSAAATRKDGSILPLPAHLKGGAIKKVCNALVAKWLALEVAAGSATKLIINDAAREALGIAPKAPVEAEAQADAPPLVEETAAEPMGKRSNSKQAQLITMLRRPEGASIEEIVAAFGWQAHTVRGAIAGALKKKLGLTIASEKIEGRGRVYRIAD